MPTAKLSPAEESANIILRIYRCNNIQAGQMMLFPAISAQFMADDPPQTQPPIQNPDRPGHHHWSHLHGRSPHSPPVDLTAGLSHLIERGYLEQRPQERTAYYLTDAGSAACDRQEGHAQ